MRPQSAAVVSFSASEKHIPACYARTRNTTSLRRTVVFLQCMLLPASSLFFWLNRWPGSSRYRQITINTCFGIFRAHLRHGGQDMRVQLSPQYHLFGDKFLIAPTDAVVSRYKTIKPGSTLSLTHLRSTDFAVKVSWFTGALKRVRGSLELVKAWNTTLKRKTRLRPRHEGFFAFLWTRLGPWCVWEDFLPPTRIILILPIP
jgi:hypothetical protein